MRKDNDNNKLSQDHLAPKNDRDALDQSLSSALKRIKGTVLDDTVNIVRAASRHHSQVGRDVEAYLEKKNFTDCEIRIFRQRGRSTCSVVPDGISFLVRSKEPSLSKREETLGPKPLFFNVYNEPHSPEARDS